MASRSIVFWTAGLVGMWVFCLFSGVADHGLGKCSLRQLAKKGCMRQGGGLLESAYHLGRGGWLSLRRLLLLGSAGLRVWVGILR